MYREGVRYTDGIMKSPYAALRYLSYLISASAVIGALAYSAAGIAGLVPVTVPIYLGVFGVLSISTLLLMIVSSLLWDSLRLIGKLAVGLWGSTAVWLWTFGTIYFLLTMDVDNLQLRWSLFIFTWEVFFMGGGLTLVCLAIFWPIQTYLDNPENTGRERVQRIYRLAVSYPVILFSIPFIVSMGGYLLGCLQFYYFAEMPPIEVWKNLANGFVVNILIGIVFYVFTLLLLGPVRAQLEATGLIERPYRSSLMRRITAILACVVIGSILLFQLAGLEAIQDAIIQGIKVMVRTDVAGYQEDLMQGIPATKGILDVVADAQSARELGLSRETLEYIASHQNGITEDMRRDPKVVSVFIDPVTGAKQVGVVYVEEAYGPILQGVNTLGISAIFVFVTAIGITAIITLALTRSLRKLIEGIRKLEKDPEYELPPADSSDEVAELSETIQRFVHESRRLDKAKYEFVSVASHQLRTPLTHLVWMLELMEKGGPENTITKYFPDMKSSVDHLAEVVKLLLDARKLDEGHGTVTPKACDLADFIRASSAKFDSLAKQKEIAFHVDTPEIFETTTDTDLLQIAFESLVSNAIEYTPRGGSVVVSLSHDGDRARISVKDTGIGIPENIREHLFEKFVRAENALKAKPNGTGLGLYIAKESVKKLSGEITFESELGAGTTFSVTIPSLATYTPDAIMVS